MKRGSKNDFSLAHINIRSLKAKIETLRVHMFGNKDAVLAQLARVRWANVGNGRTVAGNISTLHQRWTANVCATLANLCCTNVGNTPSGLPTLAQHHIIHVVPTSVN